MPRTKKTTTASNSPKTIPTVPEAEWPYKVPENWRWTRIKYLCSLKNGRAFKPTDWSESGLPIVRIQNLNNPNSDYNYYNGNIDSDNRLYGGELLFAWSGTPGTSFGAHIWQGKDAILNQHIFRVDFDEKKLNKLFYMFAINQRLDMLISAAHGGAGLQHVTKGVFEATPIPLPPLAEQQRIVDRIERLFAKLDEAREKAQAVVDGFENRKAAILHKAFTGELTRKWREERGIGMESWKKQRLFETSIRIIDGDRGKNYPKKEDFSEIGYCVFLNAKNVTKNGFVFNECDYITRDKDEALHNGRLERGDMIITTRGTIGNVALYDNSVPYEHLRINSGMVIYRGGSEFDKHFLIWLYKSNIIANQIDSLRTGTAQPQLPIKIMNTLMLPVPLLQEQTEIVRILDSLLDKERRARDLAESVIAQIDVMKKAILARAFRGELGTNDPSEAACEV